MFVDEAVVAVEPLAVGAPDGSGAELERITTGGLRGPPEITNSAGWVLLAPPTGIIASARCLPGVRWTGVLAGTDCAATAGHRLTDPDQIRGRTRQAWSASQPS